MHNTSATTYATDAEQLAALRIPFPITEVKKRNQGGSELKYYDGFTVQQRLLDVLGTGLNITYSNPIIDYENDRVDMKATLEIEWVSAKRTIISGWGSSNILHGKNGVIINDAIKSAATDSIKVASSKFGVGAELYDSKYREGLDVRLKELVEQEAEKAFLTCQCCSGVIKGGIKKKADGTEIEFTAKEVATSTRQRFGKRYCRECANQEGKKKAPQVSPPKPAAPKVIEESEDIYNN